MFSDDPEHNDLKIQISELEYEMARLFDKIQELKDFANYQQKIIINIDQKMRDLNAHI